MRLALLGLCGLPALLAGCRQPAPEGTGDTRTAIPLPAEPAAAVRAEMRTMLGSLHAILAAPPGDSGAIHRAARASGTAAAADPTLEHLLPEQFLTLGMVTHSQFDTLAVAAGAALSRDSVVARLGRLSANCVSCHAMYRLVPPR